MKIFLKIILLIIFYLILTQLIFSCEFWCKDLLRLKSSEDKKTYWIKRKNIGSMNKQF